MINYPLFRAIGSLAPAIGAEVKSVILSGRSGVLRNAARALAQQANHEFKKLHPNLDYLYAVVVDAPIDDEQNVPIGDSGQIRGIISCVRDADGEWRAADENLVVRRDGKYLGVFLEPISNDGVRNCYLPFLVEGYPTENEPSPSFRQLAAAALRLVAQIDSDSALDVSKLDETPGSDALSEIFMVLRDAYKSFGNSDVPWNVLWMSHVDEGLTNLCRSILEGRITDIDIRNGTFGNLLFPSFSLPNPELGQSYRDGRDLKKAVSSHWSSEDQVLISIEAIVTSRRISALVDAGASPLVLERLNWSEFDITVNRRVQGGRGNPLLGLFWHDRGSLVKEAGFVDITEEEFFNPTSPLSQPMTILNPDHSPLVTSSFLDSPNIIEPVTLNPSNPRRIESKEVLVVLPMIEPVLDPTLAAASSITIVDAVPKNKAALNFEVTERIILSDGRVALLGQFFRKVSNSGTFEHLPSARSVRVVIPDGDVLIGRVQRDSFASVVMLGPHGAGVFLVGKPPKNKLTVVGWPKFDQSGQCVIENSVIDKLIEAGRYKIIVWSIDTPMNLEVGGVSVEPLLDSCVRYFKSEIDLQQSMTIEIDDLTVNLDVPEIVEQPGIEEFNSPLRACTEHGQVDLKALEDDLKDIRSGLELKLFEISKSIGLGNRHNGHIVVTAHMGEEIDTLELDPHFAVHISQSVRGNTGIWPFSAVQKIPIEVLESAQLLRFLEVFRALKLDAAVEKFADKGGPRWLSKIDLDEHFKDMGEGSAQLIKDYLDAYVDLVQFVDDIASPHLKFWVRYPFSVSIWSDTAAKLRGVLVSPYHPLRLAWLWTAESVLRTSQLHNETRKMMAGVVSGWQFPMLTRSNTQNGVMMSVPIDGGVDSIFAGWTMLVPASVDQALHLEIPDRVANGRVHGVSSSGLDSTAVEGAVDDFCNANPFVSTLIIDLAAASPAPRPSQVDRGLVLKISEWSRRRSALNQSPGGVRVFDSVNRIGEMSDEVQTLIDVDQEKKVSVTWQRYGQALPVRQANIRIMSDSGVRVSVSNSTVRNGLVSDVPLRRFEVAVTNEEGACAESSPSLASFTSTSFSRALNATESVGLDAGNDARSISLTISPDSAMLDGADWTVVGEGGLPPSALASLLQIEGVGAGSSTLWEWRPPFFEGSESTSVATVDRRPYMTVARIPKVFTGKLRGLVRHLLGSDATDAQVSNKVNEIIRILGARGVGLSSLISGKQRHRVHQKGALGFSLAFEMIDRASLVGTQRFVIPIDAAHQYLNVLSGFSRKSGGQRADLLLMELRDDELVFVPLEIKFYALENPVASLPILSVAGVEDAVSQSVAARQLMDDIVSFWGSTRGEIGTRELMNNAMAALVDAAIRLTSFRKADASTIAARLKKLVDGELDIRAGSPAVAYLVATSDTLKSRHTTHPNNGAEVFICDPRQMTADLGESEPSKAVEEWVLTLDRAFASGNITANVPVSPLNDSAHPSSSDSDLSGQDGRQDFSVKERHSSTEGSVKSRSDKTETSREIGEDGETSTPGQLEVTSPTDEQSHRTSEDVSMNPVLEQPMEVTGPQPDSENVETDLYDVASTSTGTFKGTAVNEGLKIHIGSFVDNQAAVYFWPGNTALSSLNVGIIGDMGTGKTQMCLSMVNSLRRGSREVQEVPMSGLILDYKHDYQKKEFLDAVGGVVLEPHNLPIDLFGVKGEKTLKNMNGKAMAFIEIIAMVFGGVGNVQRDRLRQVIINLIRDKNTSPTLRDVQEAYIIESNNRADSVTEILNNLVYNEVFSSNPADFRTLEEVLSEKVAVVNLRALDPDQKTKKTVVAIFLNQYFEYMIGLKKWPFRQGAVQIRHLNSFVLVDEAVNIMEYDFAPLRQILLQGREYGVITILSTQYLDHFSISGTDYAQPMRTWLVHRVPNVTKKSLHELGISSATLDDAAAISDMGLHQGYYSTFDCPGRFVLGDPFYAQFERTPDENRKW